MRNKLVAADLFAGAGGFSCGAAAAGIDIVYAANHWELAVTVHAANHPNTKHVCQDLRQANWKDLPYHDILLASPCCQGHSEARGKDTMAHDASRQTAWAVVDCVEVKRPKVLVVENVPEFKKWKLYELWRQSLETLGYHLTTNVMNAADFGVPQNRERLFIVGSLKRGIEVKSPNHKHTAAETILDFKNGSWSQVTKPHRAEATLSRIKRGRETFGDRFIIAYYGNEKGGRSLKAPLGTITTRDRFAVVDGDRMRMLTVDEYKRGMGFPAGYKLPTGKKEAVHCLGNAVSPPVATELLLQIKEQM